MLKVQLHHLHYSLSHLSSFESNPNILSFFFFGHWIQLQVTHLALSSSFGIKHRLFMNFARLLHILCSIWPYEHGRIKKFKCKDQCPIYNASPSCLGKFLFSWKTYLNLYLKCAMTFRSPDLFFLFFFFFLREREKKWPSFYLNTSKSFTCPFTKPILILVSLAFEIFFWSSTQKLGDVMTLWPNAFFRSLWYTHDLGPP